jgi:hypothetical protein
MMYARTPLSRSRNRSPIGFNPFDVSETLQCVEEEPGPAAHVEDPGVWDVAQ